MSTHTRFAAVAPLFATDAYKLGHRSMYALSGNVTRVLSNYTNRKPFNPLDAADGGVVHFGLQAYLHRVLMDDFEPFFAADTDEVCALYEERLAAILGPDNGIGSDHIRALHLLGYLPLEFRAAPEGTIIPFGVPSVIVENTHPDFAWLTNYIETSLSAGLWHPSTTATIAHRLRGDLLAWAERTGGSVEAVDFQGHDFSYRGQTSQEPAAASGAAHLLSFKGTDSLVSLDWIERYYGGPYAAMSVPATEHSVMMAGGSTVGERELFERLLSAFPAGILSVVSDTWDLWRVLTDYLPSMKDQILSRDGKLVIRPDSGNPADILCGTASRFGYGYSPETKGVIELLWETFGGTVNEAGFKVLDPHIGAIYGDSINRERANEIARRLAAKGFASTNIVFGIGSFSYQYVTRDTFGSAVKATWSEVDGAGHDMFKDPVTDSGTKKSATGRLAVLRDGDNLVLVQRATRDQEAASVLQPVWRDGEFLTHQSFQDVRDTLAAQPMAHHTLETTEV